MWEIPRRPGEDEYRCYTCHIGNEAHGLDRNGTRHSGNEAHGLDPNVTRHSGNEAHGLDHHGNSELLFINTPNKDLLLMALHAASADCFKNGVTCPNSYKIWDEMTTRQRSKFESVLSPLTTDGIRFVANKLNKLL